MFRSADAPAIHKLRAVNLVAIIRPPDVRPQYLPPRVSERAAAYRHALPIFYLSAIASAVDHRATATFSSRQRPRDPEAWRGFTLLELLIVVGIIGLLMVLIAPAFTTIKGGTDVKSAAYTIKGVLDTARTYAKANNTYTWVGFFEEDASQSSTNPATAGQRSNRNIHRCIEGRE